MEIRHKSEIAQTIETEEHRIKIRWLYEPNINQLDDILINYLAQLSIRVNKVDIFIIINAFVDYGIERADEELNHVQEIDYAADQIGLMWKKDESHDDLMATFVSSFQEAKLHLRILASTTVRRHVSEALDQLDKYEQLLAEMRISKHNQLNDKLHNMHLDTIELHRRQHKEIQTIIDFFDLRIVVKETKMGMLLEEVDDTNKIITNDVYLLKVLDGLDLLRPKWSKESNYDYLFDVNVLTSAERQRRSEYSNKNSKNCMSDNKNKKRKINT